MPITLRSVKGSALTHTELDANFTDLVSNTYSSYSTLTANTYDTYDTLTANDYNTHGSLTANDYNTYNTLTANDYNTYNTLTANDYNTYNTLTANDYNTYNTLTANTFDTFDTLTANTYDTYNTLKNSLSINRFDYVATANQTVFVGADRDGQVMYFHEPTTQIYMNGFLLRKGNDYVLTASSNTVTLQLGAIVDTEVTVTSLSL